MRKEIPMLFNSDMVRAILSNLKGLTRRVVKPQPDSRATEISLSQGWPKTPWTAKFAMPAKWEGQQEKYWEVTDAYRAPCSVGDRLYVRETWAFAGWEDGKPVYVYRADSDIPPRIYHERANESGGEDVFTQRWYPSIHMPKEAARIWLEVESVRVERLQDISEEDALAEGIREFTKDGTVMKYWACDPSEDNPPRAMQMTWSDMPRTAKEAFRWLWQTINGVESWNSNPWVWRIKFKVLSTTGKPISNQVAALHS